MIRSTFISLGLHSFILTLAYFGLPAFKTKEPVELPIDIVDETPISSKTSLKLGDQKHKKNTEIKKKIDKQDKFKKKPAPPPPASSKRIVEKKNLVSKKEKEIREIATLIKKKPKIEIEKKNNSKLPKIVKKPEKIKNKQKENLAKGILKTLTRPEVKKEENLKKDRKNSNKDVLDKIKKIAGNSNRQVKETAINLSQTDINRIQNHVRKFFVVSYAASEININIMLRISTNTNGVVKEVKIVDETSYNKSKFYRATADAARRAVLDSSPLPLPKGKEKLFSNIEFVFSTSWINKY